MPAVRSRHERIGRRIEGLARDRRGARENVGGRLVAAQRVLCGARVHGPVRHAAERHARVVDMSQAIEADERDDRDDPEIAGTPRQLLDGPAVRRRRGDLDARYDLAGRECGRQRTGEELPQPLCAVQLPTRPPAARPAPS